MEPGIEQRLARLEAVEEIRRLKHRYLRACDLKQSDTFRECFVAHGAVVDYGPRLGRFEDADGIAAVYRREAVERVSAIEYDDRYEIEDGQWRIRSCQVRVLWTLVKPLPEGHQIIESLS